jgi:hypothetical protein
MNTQISSKFAALAVALILNAMIAGAAACLLNFWFHENAAAATYDCPKSARVLGAV